MLIFASDVHVIPGDGKDSDFFIHWLAEAGTRASQIYILGDLFDYWFTGAHRQAPRLVDALASAQVRIVPGNRDFLLANSRISGIEVLDEEVVITSPSSTRVLLAHGHTLTRGDFGFKVFHALGWPLLKVLDRRLRGTLKDRLARFLVRSSSAVRAPRTAIDPGISRRRKVDTVLCGHLHHGFMSRELIVLPAFFDTRQWLVWDSDGPRLEGY
ncbi:MAG: UDP-2,3-diacylglucosamine diphosphatase [Desulfomonilia bacterium]|jgi:UDP-2,3-diacylglucosamine pyrophosphatase LpxH